MWYSKDLRVKLFKGAKLYGIQNDIVKNGVITKKRLMKFCEGCGTICKDGDRLREHVE